MAVPSNAQDSGAYINLGVNTLDFDAYSLGGKLGYNFNEYFGVEGEASFGIIDDESDGVDIGVESAFGGYATARYPVSSNIEIFARAGYHTTKVDVSANDELPEDITFEGTSFSVDGIAFGGGVQYFFSENNGVRLDYTHRDFDNGFGNSEVYSVSYVRKF